MTFKADLHVHSRHSENPTHAGIRAFNGRESYTDPLDVYAAARARGMDLVTITDHNTLDGSLAIAHLPGTFLSAEFDTWFPENGCRVHVVALGLDEAAFRDADGARASIHDLVTCLREAGVLHYIAHPLFDMTDKLTIDTVEKLLLLFNVLEGLNGARPLRCNGLLRQIAASLTPESIAAMAERQRLEPYGETPWRKSLTGGSDDHTGLFVAGAHTVAGGDGTPEGFLAAVAAGDCAPAGDEGDARLLAHSIYSASFWRLREMLRLDEAEPRQRALGLLRKGFGRIGRDVPVLEKTRRGVRSMVPGLYRDGDPRGPAWEDLLEREIGSLLAAPGGIDGVGALELDRRLFSVASTLADDVLELHLPTLLEPARQAGGRQRLRAAFAVGMVHFLELPYFIAWSRQSRDRASQEALRRHFLEPAGGAPGPAGDRPAAAPPAPRKIAVLADALDGAGGGASPGILRLVRAAAARDIDLRVVTCTAAASESRDDVVRFRALAARPLTAEAGLMVTVPPIVDILDFLEENDFTAIHAGSAGPMGLVALLAAKLLHVPVSGAFSGDLPREVERLWPGSALHGHAWRYIVWFYSLLDEVFVPSRAVARDLVARGLDPGRVHVLPARHGGAPGDGERDDDGPQAYADAVLDGLAGPSPRPGWRHSTDVRAALAHAARPRRR